MGEKEDGVNELNEDWNETNPFVETCNVNNGSIIIMSTSTHVNPKARKAISAAA